AYALSPLVDAALGFVLLGVVALATLAAALLHGPALAALGLVGAEVTPILVSTNQPNYWALYVFLGVVTAATFALARIRLWRCLAITAVVFCALWALPRMGGPPGASPPPHPFPAIVQFAAPAPALVLGLFHCAP